jgi:hypothetical protein
MRCVCVCVRARARAAGRCCATLCKDDLTHLPSLEESMDGLQLDAGSTMHDSRMTATLIEGACTAIAIEGRFTAARELLRLHGVVFHILVRAPYSRPTLVPGSSR